MDFDDLQFDKHLKRENRRAWQATRRAMGQTALFARRMHLAGMKPLTKVASSDYCLTDTESEYLIYLPIDHYGSVWRTLAGKIL